MGTGCKREALGDIVFVPEGAQFVAEKTLTNYLNSNLTQIGSAPVTLTEISADELLQKEEKVKVINATVADLRLDAVAAAGYGVSRSRMSDEIKSLNVKLNWKEAKKAAQAVNEGDVISFRGRGRVEVAEIRGTTKKGRISVTLKRFI
jgi:RNA-binding protein YlmH